MRIWSGTSPKILIQKRKTRQKVTRTYTHLSQMSQSMANGVKVNLVRGIRTFKKKIKNDMIETLWRRGDYSGIAREIPWDKLDADLEPTRMSLTPAIARSAQAVITSLPPHVDENMRFDMTNPKIRDHVGDRMGLITQGLKSDTHDVIQAQVKASFDFGLTPRQVANNIKGSIGLTDRYAGAVINYQDRLLKKGFSKDDVVDMGSRYADQLLNARALAIARTETRAATNNGQQAVWQQAAEKGLISDNVERIWIVDGRPCEDCEPMDGERVGLYEPWILKDGTVCYVPSDAHPNCMCGMELDLKTSERDYEDAQPDEDDNEQDQEDFQEEVDSAD